MSPSGVWKAPDQRLTSTQHSATRMEFYVYLNGARRGPFTEERVQTFLSAGLLVPTDLAAEQATGEWRPLSTFRRFAIAPPVTPAPAAVRVEPPPMPSAPVGSRAEPDTRAALASDETLCYQTSLHWFIFVRFALAGVALFVFVAVPFAIAMQALIGTERGWFVLPLPAFLLLPPAIAFASSEIVITDRRVLIKTGVVRRQTVEMFLSKVESVTVEQGFFGRLLDFGTVRIRGTGGFEEGFDSIAKPLLFRNWIQRLQSGERLAAGDVTTRAS